MPGTEMATYEDDDTRLDFDVESDLSRFLSSVLQRTDQISQSKVELLEDLLGLEFTLLRRCWEYLVGIYQGGSKIMV